MSKVTGLGQGVNLLFGNHSEDEKFFDCDIQKILPNKHQPRLNFSESELQELANSIKENGIIQPLLVSSAKKNGYFILIAGERRLRASKLAGLTTVPVVLRDVEDENAFLELAIIENVQRTDLNPIEEAEAYSRLIEKFGYTQDDVARKVAKNRTTITNMLRLLNLPLELREDVVAGVLSEGHARSLLRLNNDPMGQKEVRDLIVKNKLSVRQTERLIQKLQPPSSLKVASKSPDEEIPASYLKALSNQLVDKLQTNVKITQKNNGGKIEIDFFSLDDLERLVGLFS